MHRLCVPLALAALPLAGCVRTSTQPKAEYLFADQPDAGPAQAASEMSAAAVALLGSLDDAQRGKISLELEDEERMNWGFVPRARQGLPLKEMTRDQRGLAHALLAAGLSQRGHADARQIIELESVLRALEGRDHRDPELYFVSIFGTPAEGGTWGWRFEGHHLSLNFTIVNGRFIAGAPSFFGANPAEHEQMRTLEPEESLGRKLILALPEDQRKLAIISERAFGDIVSGASRTVDIGAPEGLPLSQMSPGGQEMARALVSHYANRLREELAAQDLAKIEAAGWETVRFAWAGSTEPGRGHYYRFHGPTFLVEYDNTQNRANHIHTAWRDLTNDFGRDLLHEHYENRRQDPAHGHDH
jgi:hypothetical protein